MCSTPRSSGSARKVHAPMTKEHIHSQSQLMRRASEMYDRKQEEKAKRQAENALLKHEISEEPLLIQTNEDIQTPLAENNIAADEHFFADRFKRMVDCVKDKMPPIVTT